MTIIMVNNDDEVSNDMISMIRESRVEQLVVSRSARVSGSISGFTARFSWRVTTTSYITLDLSVCINSRCATCSRVMDTLSAKYRSPKLVKQLFVQSIALVLQSTQTLPSGSCGIVSRAANYSLSAFTFFLLFFTYQFYFLTYVMYRDRTVYFKTLNFQRKF